MSQHGKAKKRRKNSFLNEIKKLDQPLILNKSHLNESTHLEQLISQFRGGEKDFKLAFESFMDLYEKTQNSCEDLRNQLLNNQSLKREKYGTLISRFKSTLDRFLRNYSPQEQGTLVEAFISTQFLNLIDLYRTSFQQESSLSFTPEQIQTCIFYWVHYQIFQPYLIHPPEVTEFLWQQIDQIFFSQKDKNN